MPDAEVFPVLEFEVLFTTTIVGVVVTVVVVVLPPLTRVETAEEDPAAAILDPKLPEVVEEDELEVKPLKVPIPNYVSAFESTWAKLSKSEGACCKNPPVLAKVF